MIEGDSTGVNERPLSGRLDTEATLRPPVGPRDRIRGTGDGPVVTVYADFDCAACRTFYGLLVQVPPEVRDRFRYAHRHFPMTSSRPRAMQSALAAEAAAEQGRFWDMFDLLIDAHGRGEREPGSVFRHAEELGLDMERFRSDVEGRTRLDRIWEDLRSGRTSGVTGTPAVFIEGRTYEWPGTSEELERDLRQLLATP